MKLFAALFLILVLAACRAPPPINPAEFVGCYYSNTQRLPFIKITATSFQVPELRYADPDIKFERIKERNLIRLSSPYGLENNNGKLQFANLSKHTRANGLYYQLTSDGLLLIAFPAGNYVPFTKGQCS